MAAALTLGLNTSPSTVLTSPQAGTLSENGSANSTATKNTLVGTSAGTPCFGQLYAQGNAGAWPALAAIGSPDGNGFLDDATTLENQQMVAGTWTPSLRLTLSAGTSFTADVYMRAYKRSSGGVYTLINSFLFSNKSITTGGVTTAFGGASLSAVSFGVGDKLYIDCWLNILTSVGTTGATTIKMLESTPIGTLAATSEMLTPGYVSTAFVPVRNQHRAFGRIQ
jgi:hypothetical protein